MGMGNRKRVLVMTAVEAERDAVLRGLGANSRVDVKLAGVGPASAAAQTALALAGGGTYSLVVSAGIAGGFAGQAEVGTLVVASHIVAGDLGVETGEGFASVDTLGFGRSRLATEKLGAERLVQALRARGWTVCSGPIVTVSTATGTAETAAVLADRVPGVAAEGMEGFGVASAAHLCGIPVIELRAVSNAVGPRNREAWDVPGALALLTAAAPVIEEAWQWNEN